MVWLVALGWLVLGWGWLHLAGLAGLGCRGWLLGWLLGWHLGVGRSLARYCTICGFSGPCIKARII